MTKNTQVPSQELIDMLSEGVQRHGAAGLVEKMKMSWSIVLNASHGVAVDASRIPQLTDRIKLILGLEKDVEKLRLAASRMTEREKINLCVALREELYGKFDPSVMDVYKYTDCPVRLFLENELMEQLEDENKVWSRIL